MTPKLVTARQAAEILGCSIFTVRRLDRSGVLPAVRLTKRGNLRFRLADVEALTERARGLGTDSSAVEPEARSARSPGEAREASSDHAAPPGDPVGVAR